MQSNRAGKIVPKPKHRANENRDTLSEIRKNQRAKYLLIGRATFERLVRELWMIKTGLVPEKML